MTFPIILLAVSFLLQFNKHQKAERKKYSNTFHGANINTVTNSCLQELEQTLNL